MAHRGVVLLLGGNIMRANKFAVNDRRVSSVVEEHKFAAKPTNQKNLADFSLPFVICGKSREK